MGFSDKFKELAKQAQEAVVEHRDQITQAVDNASVVANERTGGKYSDKIAKAGKKTERLVDRLGGSDQGTGGAPRAPGQEAAGGHEPAPPPSA